MEVLLKSNKKNPFPSKISVNLVEFYYISLSLSAVFQILSGTTNKLSMMAK